MQPLYCRDYSKSIVITQIIAEAFQIMEMIPVFPIFCHGSPMVRETLNKSVFNLCEHELSEPVWQAT
jgi:hypothetical protein